MALLTWRERNTKGEEFGPVWYLDFDATMLEEFTRSAEVTQFPVENGAVLTDHYQPQPRAITLEVQVSDTPNRPDVLLDGKQNAAKRPFGIERAKHLDLKINRAPVTGISGVRIIQGNVARFPKKRTASVLVFDGEVTRTVDVFQVLDGLMTTAQLVNVLLFQDVEYDNMVITNIRTPRDAQSGSTLSFTLDLLQITFATTETGAAPAPTEKKHKPKQDGGNKNPTSSIEAEAEAIARGLDYPQP